MHGVHGVGKTTFAAGADAPVVIMTEDGLRPVVIMYVRFPLSLRNVEDLLLALSK